MLYDLLSFFYVSRQSFLCYDYFYIRFFSLFFLCTCDIISYIARSISEDFSSGNEGRLRDAEDVYQGRERDRSREREDRDEGTRFLFFFLCI